MLPPTIVGAIFEIRPSKPLVSVEQDGELAAATEEQAVRTIYRDEVDVINYDGPGVTMTWPIEVSRAAA